MRIKALLVGIFVLSSFYLVQADAFSKQVIHLEKAKELLSRAQTQYSSLNAYQANFEREFPLEGDEAESIFIRFEKPFSIYMHWKSGSNDGLQVLYSKGRFEDKILARPKGFLFRLIPIVPLAKDDPRVAKEESHSIDNAGVGYFLSDFSTDFNNALQSNQVSINSVSGSQIGEERITSLDVSFNVPERKYPRVTVGFSEDHGLPIEMKLYDQAGELAEIYRYMNLKVDVARDNKEFKSSIDQRLYHSYKDIPENSLV